MPAGSSSSGSFSVGGIVFFLDDVFFPRWSGRLVCSARLSSPRWSTWCWPPTTRARRSSAPVKISVLVALVALVDSIGGPATSLWSVPGQGLDQDNRFRFFSEEIALLLLSFPQIMSPSWTRWGLLLKVNSLFQVDPDLALDMKRVRQDDCADLEGLSLNLGKWVQAGKVAVDSGLAYIMGLF